MLNTSLTFAERARSMRDLGYPVLPLPRGSKSPPPTGYTGADAVTATDPVLDDWSAAFGDSYNIAVVMPENVVGIDCDVRDDKRGDLTITEAEARFGELPPTYSVTARGEDSPSRIFLFRRHTQGRLRGFLSGPDGGVEIIQHDHRYIVGPGSEHPEGGIYTVYGPDGLACDDLPPVADLPLLPRELEDDLLAGTGSRASGAGVAEFLDGLPGGDYDDDTQRVLDEFDNRLNADEGWGQFADDNTQAAMLRVTGDLAIAGACGASGVPSALAAAEDIFITYRVSRGDGLRDAAGAWERALGGAVGYIRDNGIVPLEPFEVPADLVTAARNIGSARDVFGDRLITRRGLAVLPKPEPLIGDTIDRRTVALLAGYHGTGKSFVALAWGASVATGTPWLGRSVSKGRVLYIVGEGAHGIDGRLDAWEQANGVEIEDDAFVTYPAAAQIADPRVLATVLRHLSAHHYDLVIVDTVARSAVGLDENSAKDMGLLIDAAEQIKRGTESGAVLLVHHTGKDRATVRGSSALEAAMDTVYTTEGDPLNMKLRRTKRKDGPTEDQLHLRLKEVGRSAVLESLDIEVQRKASDGDLEVRAWVSLGTTFGDRVFTKAEAITVLTNEDDAGLSRASAYRVITRLGLSDVLHSVDGAASRTARFILNRDAARKLGLPDAQPIQLDGKPFDLSEVI